MSRPAGTFVENGLRERLNPTAASICDVVRSWEGVVYNPDAILEVALYAASNVSYPSHVHRTDQKTELPQ